MHTEVPGKEASQETEPNCGRSENRSTDRKLRDDSPEFNAGAKGEEYSDPGKPFR